MWSYYGSKSKIVKLYPPPIFNKIIEPFAGSARYSLLYFDKDITLVDKNIKIIKIWEYLKNCNEKDILSLPILKEGETLDDFNLSEGEKLFLGFIVNEGSATPCKQVTRWAAPNYNYKIKETAKILFKIKHWKLLNCCYTELGNEQATWFIDPPYTHGGEFYPCSKNEIDFKYLSDWCKSRKGQTIVCENTKADWLPFIPIRKVFQAKRSSIEAMWVNLNNI
jgi:site-specific DNA-adenine methylase